MVMLLALDDTREHDAVSLHQLAVLCTVLGKTVNAGPPRQKLMKRHLLSLSHLLRQSSSPVERTFLMGSSSQNLSVEVLAL